jgi:hypothetical protein
MWMMVESRNDGWITTAISRPFAIALSASQDAKSQFHS